MTTTETPFVPQSVSKLKPAAFEKKLNKLLHATVSKDETRPYLMGIYHDEATKSLVACDGHRAIFLRSLYCEELKGIVINPSNCSRLTQREYPRMNTIFNPDTFQPKKTLTNIRLEPHHFRKPTKEERIKKLHFLTNGEIVFELNEITSALRAFTIDCRLLKELCDGESYTLHYTNELAPVIFELGNDKDYYVAMPVKV